MDHAKAIFVDNFFSRKSAKKASILGSILFVFAFMTEAHAAERVDLKHPDWHPDGGSLVAEGSCAGSIDIYLIDLTHRTVKPIWDGGLTEGYPRWFGDGRRIAFHQIDADSKTAKLFVAEISPEGVVSGVTAVSDGQYNIEPAPSPDGEKLAHSSWGDGTLDIALSSVGGDRLKIWPTQEKENFPSWSADGDRIIFHSSKDTAPAQIFTREVASGGVAQITTSAGPNFTANVNSDGTFLAFASERDGDREIYLMDMQSRTEQRLTHRQGRDGYPKFSPDGRQIAFHSVTSELETVIRVIDLDESTETIISCGDFQ